VGEGEEDDGIVDTNLSQNGRNRDLRGARDVARTVRALMFGNVFLQTPPFWTESA